MGFHASATSVQQADSEPDYYYTTGFNDACVRGIYNRKYKITSISNRLKRHAQHNKITEKDIEDLNAIQSYNEGFMNGLLEKYDKKTNVKKLETAPVGDLESGFTYTMFSTPGADMEETEDSIKYNSTHRSSEITDDNTL